MQTDPQPLTPQEIAEARALCDAATPEPWRQDERYVVGGENTPGSRPGGEVIVQASPTRAAWGGYGLGMRLANAAFIAAARTLLPRALATIAERDAELVQLRALLQRGIEETRGPNAPSVGLLRWRVDAMEVLGEEVQHG